MNKLLFNGHEIVVKTKNIEYNGKTFRLLLLGESFKISRIYTWDTDTDNHGRTEIFPQTRISVILCIESWDGVCILS